MDNAIIVALIGLAGSALGSVLGVMASSKLTQYRLEQLERKVDKHNNLVERTYRLEEQIMVLENKVKVGDHRIDDLEKGIGA